MTILTVRALHKRFGPTVAEATVSTSTARAGTQPRRRRRLPPRVRKIALTIHVAVSVGWLGSSYTMLVLAS